MAITPEERQRIFEEEQLRAEARRNAEKTIDIEVKDAGYTWVPLGALLAGIFSFFAAAFGSTGLATTLGIVAVIGGIIALVRKYRKGLAITGIVFGVLGLLAAAGMSNPDLVEPSPAAGGGGAVAPQPAADTSELTMADYNQIRTGMSYDQVVGILGAHGEEMSSVDLGGDVTAMYSWSNPWGSNIMLTFQNGRVVSKAQFGLN